MRGLAQGSRSLQRSAGPFAYRSLSLLCAAPMPPQPLFSTKLALLMDKPHLTHDFSMKSPFLVDKPYLTHNFSTKPGLSMDNGLLSEHYLEICWILLKNSTNFAIFTPFRTASEPDFVN